MWKANKLVSILLWVLALISVVLCVYVFVKCSSLNEMTQKTEMMKVISPLFIWMYVLVGITALLSVLLPVPHVIENPKSAKGIAIGIVGFAAVVCIALLLAKAEELPFVIGHEKPTEWTLKFTDVNLISIYLMLGGTILTLIVTGINGLLKTK